MGVLVLQTFLFRSTYLNEKELCELENEDSICEDVVNVAKVIQQHWQNQCIVQNSGSTQQIIQKHSTHSQQSFSFPYATVAQYYHLTLNRAITKHFERSSLGKIDTPLIPYSTNPSKTFSILLEVARNDTKIYSTVLHSVGYV